MLRRVKICGYKSLADVSLDLGPLVVLFGPNAAGKSNFLDALQLLSRIGTSKALKDAFEPPYRGKPLESFAYGPRGLPELMNRDSASFTIQADIDLSDHVVANVNRQIEEMRRPGSSTSTAHRPAARGLATVSERALRYRVEVEVLPRSGILRVADEYLAALNTQGEPTRKRKPFLERMGDRLHLRMEGQAHPTYVERYLDHSVLSKNLYAPHYPHLTAVREELATWMFFYFEPRERMRANSPIKEVRHIGPMGEDLATFLNTLSVTNPRQFRAVERALSAIVPSITKIEVKNNRFGEVELGFWEGEREISARTVSEGTLRILGLLAVGCSSDHPGLIGFEEPENGVHPRRIRLIAERLKAHTSTGNNQLIVTTHSTLLADLMPDESLVACLKRDGATDLSPYCNEFVLGRRTEIDGVLDDEDGEFVAPSVSKRILRGDFDV